MIKVGFNAAIWTRDGHAESFARALDEAREEGRDADFRAHLRSVARENSWSARVMAALRALDRR